MFTYTQCITTIRHGNGDIRYPHYLIFDFLSLAKPGVPSGFFGCIFTNYHHGWPLYIFPFPS